MLTIPAGQRTGSDRAAMGPRVLSDPARPREAARFSYGQDVFDLTLVASPAGDAQALAVLRDECEFALVVDDSLAMLCYRFGEAIPWGAALLDREATLEERSSRPMAEPINVRALLSVRLVDGRDMGVRATRNVTLSLDFTRALREAVRDQARIPFDPRAHEQAVARLNRRCPTPAALVAYASARTLGSC
jgi:hypothetical protein